MYNYILAQQLQMAATLQQFQMNQHNNCSSESEEEDSEDSRTLFCANLDDRTTEELLYEAFLQAGPIESVRIPKDNSGRQRSFGFVTYVHKCSAPYALELLQGLTFFRKTMTIKYQGNVNQQRRSFGNGAALTQNSGGSGAYDNSALRGSNLYANDNRSVSPTFNPFKQDLPNIDKPHISRHASTRQHHNNVPYQRVEQSRNDQHVNRRQQSHQPQASNRRSGHRRR